MLSVANLLAPSTCKSIPGCAMRASREHAGDLWLKCASDSFLPKYTAAQRGCSEYGDHSATAMKAICGTKSPLQVSRAAPIGMIGAGRGGRSRHKVGNGIPAISIEWVGC